jgi:hypothetical protein
MDLLMLWLAATRIALSPFSRPSHPKEIAPLRVAANHQKAVFRNFNERAIIQMMIQKLKATGMAARMTLLGLIAITCASCASSDSQEGVHRAQQEISSGTACIYSTSVTDRGQTDPHSGLPYLVIELPVTPELLSMINAHNETIYAKYPRKD